jgi:alpha-glucosidase
MLFIFLIPLAGNHGIAFGQSTRESQPPISSATVTPLSNGVKAQLGDLQQRITALRDDVLRITLSRKSIFPEDASWAVLASARHSSVQVASESSNTTFGFRTHAMKVEIDRLTLEVTVRDLNGNILQQDAKPIRFDGDAFHVSKVMPLDEHYFGLGDKTGPLDRRNEAFTLWNTDS